MGEQTDRIERALIDVINNNNIEKKQLTWVQVLNFLSINFRQFIVFLPVFLVVGGMVWKVYAEPVLDKKIEEKLKPISIKQDQIESVLERMNKTLNEIEFNQKKIQLIQEKTTKPKILEEVNRETEVFRPKK